MKVETIPIASIVVGPRLRALDPVWVRVLVEEIGRDGQAEPIRVVARGSGFVLIDGARRIAARRILAHVAIDAWIEPEEALADANFVRMGEIAGNWKRSPLTVLDRALYVAAWRELYLRQHKVRGAGRPPALTRGNFPRLAGISREGIVPAPSDASDPFLSSLSEAMREALGISERSIRRLLSIASIGRDRAARLVGHPSAESQTELLLLASEPPERQSAILDLLSGERPDAATVAEAIDLLDGCAASPPAGEVEKFQQRFARLSLQDQEATFDLMAEDIERWLATRDALPKKPVLRVIS